MALSRRYFLAAGASAAGFVTTRASSAENCSPLTPTESIDPPPEYLPGAPIRTSLREDGSVGQRLRIFGRALTTRCEPLSGARVDFWQTDKHGNYDMEGYRLRAGQYTDKNGAFALETVMPGPYNGPRHVHFLLATRMGNQPQPLMLSGGIFFPTAAEFAARPASRRPSEFLDPGSLRTLDGVLLVPCDIVVAVI